MIFGVGDNPHFVLADYARDACKHTPVQLATNSTSLYFGNCKIVHAAASGETFLIQLSDGAVYYSGNGVLIQGQVAAASVPVFQRVKWNSKWAAGMFRTIVAGGKFVAIVDANGTVHIYGYQVPRVQNANGMKNVDNAHATYDGLFLEMNGSMFACGENQV